jgi:3-oxoacyl-[acyl-carrier protein] reductase
MASNKKTALVTGGSGGIGSEICKYLAKNNYQVIINELDIAESRAQDVLESLENEGHSIYLASVTDSEKLKEMAAFVKEKYGHLDILVNNCGVTKPVIHDDLDGLTDDWIDKIMQINFRGSFASIRALRPVLLKAENPVVVNISSIAGRTAVGSNVAYCASKAAVDSMTMSLGRALAPEIRVVSLAPGWVNGEYAKHLPKEYIKEQENKTPLGRIAEPEDIGKALIAIAESFTFSTGCIFPVDGGRPLN